MALVNFVSTSAAGYAGIDPKNADTLYFLNDARTIYKGETPYGLAVSTTKPETGAANTLYFNPTTHEVAYWNNDVYQIFVLPTTDTVSNNANATPTAKAVFDYVAQALEDLDVSALEGRVDTLETEMNAAQSAITTIQGEGEGSIKKAADDALTAAKTYTDEQVAKKADTEHTHEIADVTGLQDALDAKANAADVYTKTQADTAIATAVANAEHLKREIVEELPDAGSADEHTIYMVGTGEGSEDSAYEEYMLINGAFEKIGSSKVDLTNYATKSYVDTAKQEAIDTAAADATSKANTAEQNAKSYTDSKIEEVEGKIPDVSNFITAADVTEGTENGAIAVKGTDVKVHGLGSAAFTESGAYDAAGTAAGLVNALDVTDAAVEGQYVSAVSQEDGKITVTRATLPAAPVITEGATNGSISVNGTDVKVHGLGSAAFTDSGDYATAAQGTRADQVFAALTWQEV